MLVRLRIKDYILIDELEVDFSEGFNVLTGETGAGKSILLGAIRLVLGERANGPVIRGDQKKAVIQALFELNPAQCESLESIIGECEDHTLLLSREFLANGKTICKINGELCAVSDLKSVGDQLMAIHGQFDHQQLAHSDYQLMLLDQYMNPSEMGLYSDLKGSYKQIILLKKELESLANDPLAIERELDLIAFQMEDIDQAQLLPEDEGVESKLDAMKHAEGIILDYEAINAMIDSEDDGLCINRGVNDILKRLQRIARYVPAIKERIEWLTDLQYQFKDFKDENGFAIGELQFDPYELLTLEKRVDIINHLKKKYGHTIQAVLEFRAQLESQQEKLEESRTQKEQLMQEIQRFEEKYWSVAKQLTVIRTKYSQILSRELEKSLLELNFSDAEVAIILTPRETINPLGDDHMELLVSLNKGMPLAPLKKVASGGEISRVMLAIKSIIAKADSVNTLIFDEIDAGISGQTASIVADKLYQVSRYHQVICISHLAQVGLMADTHFLIQKSSDEERTVSQVIPLNHQGRISEIARIMGGMNATQDIQDNAEKLLVTSNRRKEQLNHAVENQSSDCG